ncbi:MAG: hypothetical protein V2A54_14770 [Bacteroidota bacterium]
MNIAIHSKLSIDNISDARFEYEHSKKQFPLNFKTILLKHKARNDFYKLAVKENCYFIKDYQTLFITKKSDTTSIKAQRSKLFKVLLDEGTLNILDKTK